MHAAVGVVCFLVAFGAGYVGMALVGTGDAVGDEGDAAESLRPQSIAAAQAGVDAPLWELGHLWGVRFSSGFECNLVVARVDQEGYAQGAACDGAHFIMAEDAIFRYPFMGTFDATLASTANDARTEWYAWPLVDGKAWTTTVFDVEVEVVASFEPTLSGWWGDEPGYVLEMRLDGAPLARYDYVPSLQWWSSLTFASGFEMEVVGARTGWSGSALLAEARIVAELRSGFLSGPVEVFTVEPRDDDLVMVREITGLNVQRIHVTNPSGSIVHQQNVIQTGGGARSFAMTYLPAEPGMWRIDTPRVGFGTMALTVHGIGYETVRV